MASRPLEFDPRLSGKRFLVLEGDIGLAPLYVAVIKRLDAHVTWAGDGASARDHLTRPFDFLILDLVLPELCGLDVIEELRERNDPRLARTILYTPLAKKVAPLLGELRVLGKPFFLPDFLGALSAALDAPIPHVPSLKGWETRLPDLHRAVETRTAAWKQRTEPGSAPTPPS